MGFFNKLWDSITSATNKAGNWVNNNIINPIGEAVNNAGNWVNNNVIKPVGEAVNNAGNWVNNNVINPVGESVNNIINKTKEDTQNNGIISGIGTGIKETVNEIKEGIKPITEPIKNALNPSTETSENISTETNEDFNANGNSNPIEEAKKEKEDYLSRIWEREDKIRKETQEREDNAYQRAVADMRKAGINPNLVGINPANSGGGIINASMPESTLSAEISAYSQQLIAELARELELDENKKDRLTDILGKGLSGLTTILAFK